MRKEPWWKSKWGKENICAISYTRLRPGKNISRLECKHSFYTKALVQWINSTTDIYPKCPICRTVIRI